MSLGLNIAYFLCVIQSATHEKEYRSPPIEVIKLTIAKRAEGVAAGLLLDRK